MNKYFEKNFIADDASTSRASGTSCGRHSRCSLTTSRSRRPSHIAKDPEDELGDLLRTLLGFE